MKKYTHRIALALLAAVLFVLAGVLLCPSAYAVHYGSSSSVVMHIQENDNGIIDDLVAAFGEDIMVLGYRSDGGRHRFALKIPLRFLEDNFESDCTAIELYLPVRYATAPAEMDVRILVSDDDSWTDSATSSFPQAVAGQVSIQKIEKASLRYIYTSGDIKELIYAAYNRDIAAGNDPYVTLILETDDIVNSVEFPIVEWTTGYLLADIVYATAYLSTSQQLMEANLDDTDIKLKLNEAAFNTTALSPEHFTLNAEAAAGSITVSSVTYIDDRHAVIRLAAVDFDDHCPLSITVDSAVLDVGTTAKSNNLTIYATDEILEPGTYDLSAMGAEPEIEIWTTEPVILTRLSPDAVIGCQINCMVSGVDLTINDFYIDNTTSNISSLWPWTSRCLGFTGRGNTLRLSGSNRIYTSYYPAVAIYEGVELTIEGPGTLTVKSDLSAAIGVEGYQKLGDLIINSGTVNALNYNHYGPGIGCGMYGSEGSITINGGTINAQGCVSGAGIGSFRDSSIGEININGGTINAIGGEGAAGIGSGCEKDSYCGVINITGGVIYAQGDRVINSSELDLYDGGAGIGCGERSTVGVINISGGTVTAVGGDGSAGIGCGYIESRCDAINITGGLVFAQGDTGSYPNVEDIGHGKYIDLLDDLQVSISDKAVVFLESNRLADRDDDITVSFHDDETIADHAAYGYTVPDAWSGTAYAFIPDVLFITNFSLNPTELTLHMGNDPTLSTSQLQLDIAPEYAYNLSLVWKSETPSVASVTAQGLVGAVDRGTARISAATADGALKAECMVTVVKHVASIGISQTSAVLVVGDADMDNDSVALEAIIEPANANEQSVSWESSAPTVASVDDSGIVTAHQKGTAMITATSVDGGFTSTCEITVEHVVCLICGNPDGRVCLGNCITLTPSIGGGTWTFDPAKLSRNGNTFTPLSVGTAVVKYSLGTGGTGKTLWDTLFGLLFTSASAMNVEEASFIITTEELALASSLPGGKTLLTDPFALTPNFQGGIWEYDTTALTRSGDTFYPRKLGTYTIAYTYGTQTAEYPLLIYTSPNTGDGSPPAALYLGLMLFCTLCLLALESMRRFRH